MLTPRIAATLASLLILSMPCRSQDDVRIQAGQEGELVVPGYDHPSKLYVPSDHRSGARLPLILHMHGYGGKPSTGIWRAATGGKGYLVAGLSYGAFADAGADGIGSDAAARKAMMTFIERARAVIDERYGVDANAVFLSGLSMGGWGVNHYGFHDEARGRYRGYAILAAGPVEGVEHDVASGLPVMLLNGADDQNLAAAQKGKPLLDEAGAIVTEVVLEGQPHVPSQESMNEPLRTWLEGIARADALDRPLAAVAWRDVALGELPAKGESVPELMARHPEVAKADAARPVLVLFVSRAEDEKGKPTKAAQASEDAERTLFCYPESLGPPSSARHFTCLRIDLARIDRKASPVLHEGMAPLVLILGVDRSEAGLMPAARLRPAALDAALRAPLTEEQIADADAHLARVTPQRTELEKLFERREKLAAELAKARKKGPSKKLAAKEEELAELDAQMHALRARLLE